jgi:hypothetical protein
MLDFTATTQRYFQLTYQMYANSTYYYLIYMVYISLYFDYFLETIQVIV